MVEKRPSVDRKSRPPLPRSIWALGFVSLIMDVSSEMIHALLIAADLCLAYAGAWVWAGVALWGLHLGMTQGLLTRMVADTAPEDLRGTAYGFFNLTSGVALLAAGLLAGLLWDRLGPAATFLAGAGLAALAILVVLAAPTAPALKSGGRGGS